MKKKLVCLYSGGAKSIVCLSKILNDPQYNDMLIQVHYIHMVNYKREFQVAQERVKKSLVNFKDNFADRLIFSENQINFSCLPVSSPLPDDNSICLFVATQMYNVDNEVIYVALGYSKVEFEAKKLSQQIQAYTQMLKESSNRGINSGFIFPLVANSRY